MRKVMVQVFVNAVIHICFQLWSFLLMAASFSFSGQNLMIKLM